MWALGEVRLTKNGEIPIAIKTMPTIRIDRQNYRLPYTRLRDRRANVLNYARSLVAKTMGVG